MFAINHTVGMTRLGTVHHSYHLGNGENPPKICIPRHQLQGQACKRDFPRTAVRSAVNSLLHTGNVRGHLTSDCRKQPSPVELEEQKEKVGAGRMEKNRGTSPPG